MDANHAPTVAGYYFNYSPLLPASVAGRTRNSPVFVPSSPSINADDYSLDFLPGGAKAWAVVDSRGSLLLMNGVGPGHVRSGFPDMVVCEPGTWRYRRIPPPPEFGDDDDGCRFLRSYLVGGDGIGMSNFRVLCEFDLSYVAHVASFAVAGGGGGRDDCDDGASWSEAAVNRVVPRPDRLCSLGRAAGSWYFVAEVDDTVEVTTLVVLDGGTGEFSSYEFVAIAEDDDWDLVHRTPRLDHRSRVAEGRDGEARVINVLDNGRVEVFARLDGGGVWALEESALLPEAARALPGYRPSFFYKRLDVVTAGPGFVVLAPPPTTSRGDDAAEAPWCFSLDLDSMQVALAPDDMGPMVYRCEAASSPRHRHCRPLLA
ncbi:hypothetical protein ACP70R_032401 [Stipagrostis hirtigluma subsp. patula]